MINVLIIEDERLSALRLKGMLSEIDQEINVLEIISSVKESIKWLRLNKVDLIFLDINLEDGNAFQIFEEITVEVPIVFTTAYDEYAIKAFKFNSIDYLLKPFTNDELAQSIAKYVNSIRSATPEQIEMLFKSMQQGNEYQRSFLINIGSKIIRINVKDIFYFYADKKSVFCVKSDGKNYPLDISLDKLEMKLDPKLFFRINRKIIVSEKAVNSMYAYSRGRIKLDLKPDLPDHIEALISIEKTSKFKNWLL